MDSQPAAPPQPPPLFGLVPAGQAVLITPTQTPTPTSFLYAMPASSFSHIVVFLLPGIVLPPDTAAAIYLVTPPPPAADQQQAHLRFLGGIGPGKESAIFKLGPGGSAENVVLGVSVEPAESVATRIAQVGPAAASAGGRGSGTMVVPQPGSSQPSTMLLAQRIIKNAFNFLASFSGAAGPNGVEVVPLKAFEEWWRKFENKLSRDPSFLEREE